MKFKRYAAWLLVIALAVSLFSGMALPRGSEQPETEPEPTTGTVTVTGTGAADVTAENTYTVHTDYTFTVNEDVDYQYDITAQVNGTSAALTKSGTGYTIAAPAAGGITITVTKIHRISVTAYIPGLWLVTYAADGQGCTYGEQAMLRSEKYGAFCALVSGEAAPEVDKSQLAITNTAAGTVPYTLDLNGSGKVDVNDAQVAYNLYSGTTEQSLAEKLLAADANGDKQLNAADANTILSGASWEHGAASESHTAALTKESGSAYVGSKITVMVRLGGVAAASAFLIDYDTETLAFIPDESALHGAAYTEVSSGQLRFSDFGEEDQNSYLLVFTAKKQGAASISLSNAAYSTQAAAEIGDLTAAGTSGSPLEITIHHRVTKSDIYAGPPYAADGSTYSFGVSDTSNSAYYDYTLPTATMGGEPVEVTAAGTLAWSIAGVTGDLAITGTRTGREFTVTFSGMELPAEKANYGTDYVFALPVMEGHTVSVSEVTIGGTTYVPEAAGNRITIQGGSIKGDIKITLTKTEKNPCEAGHVYETPIYTWSEDHTTCTAQRVCACKEETETETAKSTAKENADETTTYTVSFSNPAFETQTKTVEKEELGEEIRVTFRLIGDTAHDSASKHEAYVTWISTTAYTAKEGQTVYDVFVEALSDHGLSQQGASTGYVSAIRAPAVLGGYLLSNLDNGPRSGWMYVVNGAHPDVGMQNYKLKDGDAIIWHYVDDYSTEENGGIWASAADISPEAYVRQKLGSILMVGEGGKAEPSEIKMTDIGKDVTFKFTPDEGYKIKSVTVDGESQGSIESYTYKNLQYDSRIEVVFVKAEESWFDDVKKDDWFYEDVQFVVEKGLFKGVGGNRFAPNASMTRAMLVTALYRLEGKPETAGISKFTDVKSGQYYTEPVIWATENKIVNGYGGRRFGPDDLVTREQLAAILYRYAQYKSYDVTQSNGLMEYQDYSDISVYSLKSLKWANAEGLITGRTGKLLAPKGNATRAEVAAIVHRFVKNVSKS